ncbi:hypothetical protein ER308_11840 [Egibacter rhizosphaerae]|uniref:DUF4015 domain-containing protein n=2 Tax=Egibacter rhizosphaerae TaxID=1670831 RepID=A0A411YGA5_9ACTN|nr:hypothetical protein ER308_11840 [Egibacter rhizosphaerae]
MPRKHHRRPLAWALVGAAALVAVIALAVPVTAPSPELEVNSPEDGAVLDADAAEEATFVVTASTAEAARETHLRVDGEDATGIAERNGRRWHLPLAGLDDGTRTVTAELTGGVGQRASETRTVELDTEPPAIELDAPEPPVVADEPLVVTGRLDDPDAEVRAEGAEVERDGERFSVTYDAAPQGELTIEAEDEAGNVAVASESVVTVPSRVEADDLRSVHVSFWAWTSESLREPVLDLADRGLINSVQLDLKDESGTVGYDSEVEFAHEYDAVDPIYELDEAVAELHDRDVHIAGRIVVFRDPIVAERAWEDGEEGLVVQHADGSLYEGYGGFTNFASERIREYHHELAEEAAQAGVDDILWDYVRRPDGDEEEFAFPGLDDDTTPSESIVEFIAEADERLEPYGVGHGASVYGIAVDRPDEIAQDIGGIAEHVDYVAPMVYPSHWAPGEYGIDDPDGQPYDIVRASLEDFLEITGDRRARVVPWLQDFSMGQTYGPDEVRAQIDAAADLDVEEWILWDAGVDYTEEALE